MNRRRAGFTLIEVVLAMTILGVGMVVLVASASRGLAVVKAAGTYEDARHLLARLEIEEPLYAEPLEEGSDDGGFDAPYERYRWRREIAPLGDDEENRLFEVTTRILWADRGRDRYEEVTTYVYSPMDESEIAP